MIKLQHQLITMVTYSGEVPGVVALEVAARAAAALADGPVGDVAALADIHNIIYVVIIIVLRTLIIV